MKVVIEVDKKIYQQAILLQSRGEGSVYSQIIANGTPLPKGHGDLIDRDELLTHRKCCCWHENCSGACEECSDNCVEVNDIEKTSIIIPAEKGKRK